MLPTSWPRSLAKLVVPIVPLALMVALAPASGAEETGCYAVPGNIVQNCGFETGSASPWTISVNGGYTYVTDQDWSGLPAHSGTHFLLSHSYPGSVVSQTVDTVSGVTYEVGFYVRGGDYWESSFYVNVDADAAGPAEDQTLLTRADLPAVPLPDYTLLTTQFVAQGDAATLTFILVLLPNYWFLDDVHVVPLTAPQTIDVTTPAPSSASYGESFDVAAGASSGLPVDITTTGGCSIEGTTVTMTSGSTACVVHYNQAGNGAFSPAPEVTDTVTAQKAAQTITFALLADRTLDESPLVVTAATSSGLSVTFAASPPQVCTASGDDGSTVALLATGTCTVTASQLGNSDYESALDVARSFAVSPARLAQTITVAVAPPTSAGVGESFPVAAVSSARLPVTVTTSGPCTLSRRTVTITGATDDCLLTFSQAGNANYAPAPEVVHTVATHKLSQSITFRALTDRRLAQSPLTLRATASSRLQVTFASATPTACSVDGNILTLLSTGTCTVMAAQGGNDTYDEAAPVVRSFTVR